MGGGTSIEGDVYSYEVLVLEMFIGMMPTNDMFKDGLNLHNFVKIALPKRLAQVVDPMLLPRGAVEMGATTSTMMAIEEDEKKMAMKLKYMKLITLWTSSWHIDTNMQKCILLMLNIGILCSSESPKERISMEEVIKELALIKKYFCWFGNSQRQTK